MAKRIRLREDTVGGALAGASPITSDIESSYRIQSLLTVPEAKRMMELDKEMQAVVDEKNASIADKVRRFEEILAAFRKMQDAVVAKGGILMTDAMKDAIAKQVLQQLRAQTETSLKRTRLRRKRRGPETASVEHAAAEEEDEDGSDVFHTPHPQPEEEEEEEERVAPIIHRTPSVRRTKSFKRPRQSRSAAARTTTPSATTFNANDAAELEKVKSILAKHGFDEQGAHYMSVPMPSGTRKKTKLARNTYDNVLADFFSRSRTTGSTMTRSARPIPQLIINTLKEHADPEHLKYLSDNYPTFRMGLLNSRFAGWQST